MFRHALTHEVRTTRCSSSDARSCTGSSDSRSRSSTRIVSPNTPRSSATTSMCGGLGEGARLPQEGGRESGSSLCQPRGAGALGPGARGCAPAGRRRPGRDVVGDPRGEGRPAACSRELRSGARGADVSARPGPAVWRSRVGSLDASLRESGGAGPGARRPRRRPAVGRSVSRDRHPDERTEEPRPGMAAPRRDRHSRPAVGRGGVRAASGGNPTQLWKTHAAIGRLHAAAGRAERARHSYQSARDVVDRVVRELRTPELRASLESAASTRELSDLSR